jgi:hypothetical protein
MSLRRNWYDGFEESFEIDVDSLVGYLLAVGDVVRADRPKDSMLLTIVDLSSCSVLSTLKTLSRIRSFLLLLMNS